ncbi:MAG TPA: CAP domain-containing protein [Terriglobia bacterium]|nr:CAP domain-containing protein [Terriglobia bacterium]
MNVIRAQIALIAAGLAWAALVCGAAPGQTEASGTWQHFGHVAPAGANGPGGSGAWHHFGDSGTAPKAALPETAHAPRVAGIASLETEMLELVNRARLDPANAAETRGHALPLKWNASLATVAREHSRDMLMRGYFGHDDPDGKSPGMRVKAAGIGWQAVGENIAAFDSIEGAETAFMNEPRFAHNHRANILNPKYTEIGIGIVQSRSGRYYITQEFIEAPTDLRAAFPQ